MTECDKGRRDATLCSKLLRWPRKNQIWLTARLFANIDIPPTHRFANACAERFRHSLFRRETRSQMARWKFHRHRILNFAIGKNAMQKAISEPINGPLNTRALDKIHTDPQNAHLE
jgi:hypothetical protein